MEFIKKHWRWVALSIIVIIAIIIYFKKNENDSVKRLATQTPNANGTAHIPGSENQDEEYVIKTVKTILKLGINSLEDFRKKALDKGIHVVTVEERSVEKSGPDPKRVIVSVAYPKCTEPVCKPIINIVSIG